MLSIVRSLFVSILDAGNCFSVALVLILFCLFMKTDCFQSVLAVVYFYCIVKTMIGLSNTTDCNMSSYMPEFVRRRRFVRLDGSEAPKQPSPCEEQFILEKDANPPTRNNPPKVSGDSKKKNKRKSKQNAANRVETLACSIVGSVSNDAKPIEAKPPTHIKPPAQAGGDKKKRKEPQKNQQTTKETISSCSYDAKPIEAKPPTHILPPAQAGGDKKKRKEPQKNQQTTKETISSCSYDFNSLDACPPKCYNPPTCSGNNKKKRNKKSKNTQQTAKEAIGSFSNDASPVVDDNPPIHINSLSRSDESKVECNENSQTKQPILEESMDAFSNEPAVPPGLSRKNAKKAKKKKNFAKSKFKTDDSSDGSSTKTDGAQKRDVTEKTKVYSPLKVYLDMGLELYGIYQEFKPYVLNQEQLRLYEFPLDSPQTTGKVIVNSKYRKLAPERSCCRCGTTFLIHSDGRYESGTVCRYHPSKMPSYRGNNKAATYTCCNGNYISEGCVQYQYHVTAESFLKDSDFVKTREKKYLNAEKSCTVYALDCEMLYTTNGFEVAKVGIVGIDGLTLYETFVLPEKEVLCYNTTYSGVSANDLKSVTTTLRDVQAYLLKLINKDSILVGHGLENDLRALRLIHENIVDTSVAFPHSRGVRYKRSLKSLSSEFLNKSIQESPSGHDCIEDARTCMELMLCKIQSDIENRPAVLVDENENTVLETVPPESHPEMIYYPILSSSYPFYFNESYHFASYYPDQNCRRNSMQRPHYPYLSQTKCYVYS